MAPRAPSARINAWASPEPVKSAHKMRSGNQAGVAHIDAALSKPPCASFALALLTRSESRPSGRTTRQISGYVLLGKNPQLRELSNRNLPTDLDDLLARQAEIVAYVRGILPRGGTATTSNSTIVVCDDPGAPFPNIVDVCSLK
jgi:hypothetical protein